MSYAMLEELTIDLIEVLNKHYPKLDCGYSDQSDEDEVRVTLDVIKQMNQNNLDIIYPDRRSKRN
jgi:septum formation topological specificity factor MinE